MFTQAIFVGSCPKPVQSSSYPNSLSLRSQNTSMFHTFLTSELNWSGQLHALLLYPEYALDRRLGGTWSQSEHGGSERKSLHCPC